jgi:hypothetical protein
MAPSGNMPLTDSALCPLSAATNFTVSPGAIFTKDGSNTIIPPSVPFQKPDFHLGGPGAASGEDQNGRGSGQRRNLSHVSVS